MLGRLGSIVLILSAASGCAGLCCLPHKCACVIDSVPTCESICGDECCGECGDCHCAVCRSGGICPQARCKKELLIAVGPPAVRYRPEMPPEFLPVPARPVHANVNMEFPMETRGAVERGYGPELMVQGRD